MSAAARFLHLSAPTSHGVHSKYGSPTASTARGFTGRWSRRRRPSSNPRYASTLAAAVSARGGGDEVDAGGTAGAAGGGADYRTAGEVKAALLRSLQGIDRGIFGVQLEKRSEIEGLVRLLEFWNPTPDPTDHLDQVADGCWKLLYSTITILGSKRTKLGLRDFVSLGEFFQNIDVAQGKAINEIKFSVRGFKMLSGQLTIVASFTIASKTRVDIKFESSDISPEQLMNLFQKNHDLLLAIFNPQGWLEITYIDESIRIGRDDKDNIFILERTSEEKVS